MATQFVRTRCANSRTESNTDSVKSIDRCVPSLVESGCVPGGGPSFNIRAIPLLPAAKERPKVQISVFNPLFDKGCWDTSN